MKLYAVTIKAGLLINGVPYKQEREVPISKYVYLRPAERLAHAYAPAVYTSKANALKLIAKLPMAVRDNYQITEFDSGWVDYPEIA